MASVQWSMGKVVEHHAEGVAKMKILNKIVRVMIRVTKLNEDLLDGVSE